MIVRTSQDELQQYLSDQANLTGACEKVFFPENTQEVIDIVRKANEIKVQLSVSGNHTSLTGASLPISGWVLATDHLSGILEINIQEGYAIVQPGVTLAELQNALRQHNLFFPPDPTEDSCFIGGMLGTNASGARSFKYGSTRDSVLEIEIVLPTGDVVSIDRTKRIQENYFELKVHNNTYAFEILEGYQLPDVKNAAGYYLKAGMSIIDLFIGAEGTLGILTKAKLRVLPLPKNYISIVLFFNDIDRGLDFLKAVREISVINNELKNGKIGARAIEFFDEESLKLLRIKYSTIPNDAVAAFWIEQDCINEQQYNALLEEWHIFLEESDVNFEYTWFSADESDRSKIIAMRHDLPIAVNNLIKLRGVKKLGTDIAVPNHLFRDFYSSSIVKVKELGLEYVAFGHFGDSHLHLNILSKNLEELGCGKQFCDYLCDLAIKLGGTFSAEHGVGKLKRGYLKLMLGNSNLEFMRQVKQLFDPGNILGRGNLFED